ncbi:hypothetical protein FOMA001_g4734 [Fusarium oxysporum f. sp. matthiolae]|nr:hypothetical protein FOMA001_g4734 [Fusarium oxysporum f. sp. matthiolae]
MSTSGRYDPDSEQDGSASSPSQGFESMAQAVLIVLIGLSCPKTLRMSVEVLRSPSPRPPAIVLKNLRMITRHTF